jgi:hypothetical protein
MEIIKLHNIKELAQEFMHSPKVERKGSNVVLLYDYETETGEYEWTGITFLNTIDHKYTSDEKISEYMVKAYNAIAEVIDLNWMNKEMLDKAYKHYLVYFDGYGAYEFTSTGFVPNITED